MAQSKQAWALDLGSTGFKLGAVDATGTLGDIRRVDAPPLTGRGLIREGDPEIYLQLIDALLCAAAGNTDRTDAAESLALVSQRSTFIVWDRHNGQPLTPVVSWQDRRAEEWCAARPELAAQLVEHTGLLLSPHYAGPKLADMQAGNPQLADQLRNGNALFGNLDAWLTWQWSGGTVHQTDVTMAARTAMFDIRRGDWSDELLQVFGVPRSALPTVMNTLAGARVERHGFSVSGSIADQAAGLLVVWPDAVDLNQCLINIGTGAFVMQPVSGPQVRRPGYLTGPVFAAGPEDIRYAIEGTINGVGPAIAGFGPGPTELPQRDDCPAAFMIPDQSGVGAPHWHAGIGLTLSAQARNLSPATQRRICIEGLLFRIREILDGLNDGALPERIIVAGGLAREPAVLQGLAAMLDRPVALLDEPEATLLGAARIAGGLVPYTGDGAEIIEPGAAGQYLAAKYASWRNWCAEIYRSAG